MSVLIVGAGAAGGYLGAQLDDAGRDVTFLVHQSSRDRLAAEGLRLRQGDRTRTVRVDAVTADDLSGPYDVVVIAVRAGVVANAIADVRPAVGSDTRVVPIMNGLDHLVLLTEAFGRTRVLGAATRLVTSQRPDGMIDVVQPGVHMEIGALDGDDAAAMQRTAAELSAPDIEVAVRDDIIAAMWEKFAFIAATAVLTCLVGDEIGPIVRADGGEELSRSVQAEVVAVADADGYPLRDVFTSRLRGIMTDPASAFGPSMFRDMHAGRPIEVTVLRDLAGRARRRRLSTPLLDAALVRIDVHNRGLAAA
ncbi:oxidoreductase [Mycolicibacterium moriokaense]|nr:oxidoreductase [Mycolicibacterium moriokaense]